MVCFLSSPDKPCYWLEPTMSSVRNVECVEGSEIQFTKRQRRNAEGGEHPAVAKVRPPSKEVCDGLYEALKGTEVKEKCAILSITPGHSHRYKPRTLTLNLPPPLSTLYDPASTKWTKDELLARCEHIFDNLAITPEQVWIIYNTQI